MGNPAESGGIQGSSHLSGECWPNLRILEATCPHLQGTRGKGQVWAGEPLVTFSKELCTWQQAMERRMGWDTGTRLKGKAE